MFEAYNAAGVAMPEEAWGITWRTWLPAIVGDEAERVHTEKQKHYERLLDEGYARELPGSHLAKALLWMGHPVYFVTAASERSARAVLKTFNLPDKFLWGWELKATARALKLFEIRKMHPDMLDFTYFDDREEGVTIASQALWSFAHARWTQ